MDAHVKDVVRELSAASDEERITFPEVLLADGDFEDVEGRKFGGAAMTFLPEGVEKAVRAIQRREIDYRKFCRLIADSGCVGYFISLAGRRAVYYGRTGEEHVEWFPGAKP